MELVVYVLRCKNNENLFLAINHQGDACLNLLDKAYKFNYKSLAEHYVEMLPEMHLELRILETKTLPVHG
jgi:hypothetical protein